MIEKFFLLSMRNIRHRSLRSWLTIVGIIVGVALIVFLVSMGTGLNNGVMQQLRMFGSDMLTVMPGEETDAMIGMIGGGTLRDKEVSSLEGISGTTMVIPMDISFASVEFKGEEKSTTIHASPMKETKQIYTDSRGMGVDVGRWPERDSASEVILGSLIATKKYKEEILIGDELRIRGKRFKVVGIFNEIGSSEDDNAVYMSLDNLRKITGQKGSVRMAMVIMKEGADANVVANEIKYRIGKVRGSSGVTVITPEKAEEIVGGIIGTIQIAVLFIAIFSIVVGAIGVMNTMYTSVLERRREIGIMKAIGATKWNIWAIFVIESGLIGLIGGVVGTMIGLGIAKGAEMVAMASGFKFLQIYAGAEFIIAVLLGAFFLGIISGFLPARQASKLAPAEALRYE